MRRGVIVCGANGERGYLFEKVIEKFAMDNMSKVVQFSACTIGLSPIMIEMSGVDMDTLVAVNGCGHRCSDRLIESSGLKAHRSLVLDKACDRRLRPCEFTSTFDFEEPSEEEVRTFLKMMEEAIE